MSKPADGQGGTGVQPGSLQNDCGGGRCVPAARSVCDAPPARTARPATGSRLRAAPQQLGVCPLEGRVALAVEQVRVVAVVRVPEAARVIREEHLPVSGGRDAVGWLIWRMVDAVLSGVPRRRAGTRLVCTSRVRGALHCVRAPGAR